MADGDPLGEALDVPRAVAAGVAEELTALPGVARRVLEGASVAGDPFEMETAAAAAAVPESSVVDAVARASAPRSDPIDRCPEAASIPASTRAARGLRVDPAAWRLGAHERSAQALAAQGTGPVARAHHVARSARSGDAAAAATLREAGSQAAARAPASAARWFAAALRILPASAPPEERVELLLAGAEALGATGRLEDARLALVESLAIVPDGSTELRARLTRTCAGIEHLIGRHDEAHQRLVDALDRLPDRGSPEAVAFMIELVFDASYRMESTTRPAPLGWTHWRLPGVSRSRAHRGGRRGVGGLVYVGRVVREVDARRREAAALVDDLADEQLAGRLDAAINIAVAEVCLDRFGEAETHAERVLSVGRARGQGQLFSYAHATLGFVWRVRGELDKAAKSSTARSTPRASRRTPRCSRGTSSAGRW